MTDSTLGFIACFCTVILWTMGTFSFTRATRMVSPGAVNRVRLLYAMLILSVITCIVEQCTPLELVTGPTASQLLWFGLSGFVGFTVGDYLFFSAFKVMGGRRASIFNSIAPASALLLGIFMLNESLSFMGIVGMVISIGGMLMMSLSRQEQQDVHAEGHGVFAQGVIFAVLGAACQGVGLVLSKKGFSSSEQHLSAFHATWIRLIAATISAYFAGLIRVNVFDEFRKLTFNVKTFSPLITGTIVGPVLGVSASLYAVTKIEVSVAQTILATTPVFVTLASALFYKERITSLSYWSVFICICGVIVLVWRDSL